MLEISSFLIIGSILELFGTHLEHCWNTLRDQILSTGYRIYKNNILFGLCIKNIKFSSISCEHFWIHRAPAPFWVILYTYIAPITMILGLFCRGETTESRTYGVCRISVREHLNKIAKLMSTRNSMYFPIQL